MRTLALVLTALALLTFVPAPAQAQQTASLTIALGTPEALTANGAPVSFTGVATFTADYTALLSLSGIPVTYEVAYQPAWANVVVSPASDVFPLPSTPQPGVAFTVVRTFTIVMSRAFDPQEDLSDQIRMEATTTPGLLGRSVTGIGATLATYDAPDEPCDEAHSEDLLALAREAADAYAKEQAKEDEAATEIPTSRPSTEDPDLLVQNTDAKPLGALPWIAVAGFALVGSGVGLALRKRLR